MILEIKGIETFYGLGHVLHGLSLAVAEGEVVALLGRNGAGKTTTLRSIAGLTPPRSGEIRYKGRSIAGLDTHRISQMGIALVPETRGIFSYLTARENLAIARRRDSRWQMDAVLERFPALRERLESKGRLLSGGEQEMLAIARALMTGPELLLLDEPAAGLAPEETKRLVALVRALKGRYTIVLIEHKMDIIMSVSDRISVMHFGRLIAEGTPAEIQRNREVRRAYLGGVAA